MFVPGDRSFYLSLSFLPITLSFLVQTATDASAQINPDATLPENTIVTPNGDTLQITGGTTADTNLFHSFEQFSLPNGQTAWFDNAGAIKNIIGRVTGNSISAIDGLIKANGTANLFLLNPNGIVFGENSALDIGGSFVGSTAQSLHFADGGEFSTAPGDSPLLTVSIPLGLQHGTNSADVTVAGGGNNLVLNPDSSLDRSNRPPGLEVKNGKTLALSGGNINLSGGNLTATEGNIELWAVNNGWLLISDRQKQLQIATETDLTYGNIQLTGTASVDVSGNSGGRIQLQGQNISVTEGSIILSDTLGTGLGGNITVNGRESINVIGFNPLNPIFSGILADVAPRASGTGGNVNIETQNLYLTDGGQISSGTFGAGNAGNLQVQTQDLQIRGGSPFGPSGLFTPVALGATGNGGNLTVETDSLAIVDAGQISSQTFGFGNSGNIIIKAENIYIDGANQFAPSNINAYAFKIPGIPPDVALLLGAGIGDGGNITIETGTLQITDGGQISVSTSGTGNAGNLSIQAQNIELSGFVPGGRSGLFANTIVESGDGGNIDINSDRLSVKDGAVISVGNFASNPRIPPGTGKAGKLTINTDLLEMASADESALSTITASTNAQAGGNIIINANANILLNQNSRILAETRGDGDGGNIELTANDLNLRDRATVSVNSIGAGNAGNIKIQTRDRLDANAGRITANSQDSGGGDIAITADFIDLQNNSGIDTSVFDGTGGGGNIGIDTRYVLARSNSDIRANAVQGDGGNIDINTEVILLSRDSEIDASSEFGLDGAININNLNLNKQLGIIELPARIVDPTALIVAVCATKDGEALVTTGKGGLAENPRQNLRGESVWEDLRDVAAVENHSIVEAKAWNLNEKGNLELLSSIPVKNQTDYGAGFYQCQQ